ncbi:9078_t:CDS:10, partial [Entrophospora sp. SA101]
MIKPKGIVAVIGTTGVGKSNLGVQLGKAINGEVVNVDSMQVYKGLDIITNKISVEECEGVPHHLMDFLETHQEYRVTQFIKDALHEKIPSSQDPQSIYKQLQVVDPIMANKWHWKDTRRVYRSLKVYLETGTTGVGKSNLGVQLGKAINGEVVNVDSMQVYKGLDIITNKISVEECEGVPHHLMDFLETHQEYRVTQFIKDALHEKIPSSQDPQSIYKQLQVVDPIMANKWHWKDTRRVYRSLKVYLETGKPHSQWIKEQNLQDQKIKSLRTCIFWLYADNKVLDPRLDSRVDKMIQNGLFEEIKFLRNLIKNGEIHALLRNNKVDYTRGIWQAIGYKEFDNYLSMLESNTQNEKNLEESKRSGTELMKIATRQYARRQVHWVSSSSICRLYLLDATKNWNQNVRDIAIKTTKEFLETGIGPDPTTINDFANKMLSSNYNQEDGFSRLNTWKKYQCDICKLFNTDEEDEDRSSVAFNGKNEWEQHLNSKWHKSSIRLKKEIDEKWN